jgi:hypothetical protein
MEKFKDHIKRNQKRYIFGGIAFAGITTLIVRGRHATMQSVVDGPSQVTVRPFSLFSKQDNQIVTTIHNSTRGHPGFRVLNLEHMIDFNTQGETAKAFGISPAMLSSHLNGKIDNVNGLHFERIAA